MSNKKKGQLAKSTERHKHLRNSRKRVFWKSKRMAERSHIKKEQDNPEFRSDSRKNFVKFLWNFCQYTGLRYIWYMIDTPVNSDTGKKKPSNFLLWVIGVYTALFGLGFQKYEMRVNRIENQYNSWIEQLGNYNTPKILTAIADMQISYVPVEPTIWPPNALATLTDSTIYTDLKIRAEKTLTNWSNRYDSVKIDGVQMRSFSPSSDVHNLSVHRSDIKFFDFTGWTATNLSIGSSEFKYLKLSNCFIDDFSISSVIGSVDELRITGSTLNLGTIQGLNPKQSTYIHRTHFNNIDFVGSSFLPMEQKSDNQVDLIALFTNCSFDSTSFEKIVMANPESNFIGCVYAPIGGNITSNVFRKHEIDNFERWISLNEFKRFLPFTRVYSSYYSDKYIERKLNINKDTLDRFLALPRDPR